jgi:hypothetical protein
MGFKNWLPTAMNRSAMFEFALESESALFSHAS